MLPIGVLKAKGLVPEPTVCDTSLERRSLCPDTHALTALVCEKVSGCPRLLILFSCHAWLAQPRPTGPSFLPSGWLTVSHSTCARSTDTDQQMSWSTAVSFLLLRCLIHTCPLRWLLGQCGIEPSTFRQVSPIRCYYLHSVFIVAPDSVVKL